MHHGDWRSSPCERPNIDTSGGRGEEIAHRHQLRLVLDGEVRVDCPAGDVDERLSGTHRIGDRGQSRLAIDADVHPVPVTRKRWPVGPSIAPPLERVSGPDTSQATAVMLAASRLDDGARSG